MMRTPPPRPAPLTVATQLRLDLLFTKADRVKAAQRLIEECGQNLPFCEDSHPDDLDRIRIAALKLSGGHMDRLHDAIELAKTDTRDLLMAAGFGHDISAHMKWMPPDESVV